MKKILILITSFILLTGCNISNSKTEPTIEEYKLTVNNIELKPQLFFNNIRSTVGTYNSYHYEDDIVVFEYDSFEIGTYFENNIEKIFFVRITNEDITTDEGLKLGDSKEKMIKVYGKEYTKELNKYTYKLNNTSLSFIIDNDIIIEIEYN